VKAPLRWRWTLRLPGFELSMIAVAKLSRGG
jgi:hypothetical protein